VQFLSSPMFRADRRTSVAASTCAILAASLCRTASPVVAPSSASTEEGMLFMPIPACSAKAFSFQRDYCLREILRK
jgi:hypothetical protein